VYVRWRHIKRFQVPGRKQYESVLERAQTTSVSILRSFETPGARARGGGRGGEFRFFIEGVDRMGEKTHKNP